MQQRYLPRHGKVLAQISKWLSRRTAAAATILSGALGPDVCADMDVQPMTVWPCANTTKASRSNGTWPKGAPWSSSTKPAWSTSAPPDRDGRQRPRTISEFSNIAPCCCSAIRISSGPVSGLSLWQSGSAAQRLEDQFKPPVVCADGEVQARRFCKHCLAHQMMRIEGKTAFSAKFAKAVTGISRATAGARATSRASSNKPPENWFRTRLGVRREVAAQSRQEVREAMNTIVVRHANAGGASLVFRLVDPRRRSAGGTTLGRRKAARR